MKVISLILLVILYSQRAISFEYDHKDLSFDLNNASDIVIAKKISGRIAYADLTHEISSYDAKPIEWRDSPAWERLQDLNRGIDSTFLVLNSIKGTFEIGDRFTFNDSSIPVELGSVQLYFLYWKNDQIQSNPCHRIPIGDNKQSVVELSSDPNGIIDLVLRNKLSFCDSKN